MSRILVLLYAQEDQEALKHTGHGLQPVYCATEAELNTMLKRGIYDRLLISLQNQYRSSAAPYIASLRTAYPLLWIVGYLNCKDDRVKELRLATEAGRAGTNEILTTRAEIIQWLYGHNVAARLEQSIADRVLHLIGSYVPPNVCRFLHYAILHARQCPSVEYVTKEIGITRQTLARQCKEHQLPVPLQLLSWCRVLVASALIGQPGSTADHIGYMMFGSPQCLRNMLKRYTGLSTSDVKLHQGLDIVLPIFIHAIRFDQNRIIPNETAIES